MLTRSFGRIACGALTRWFIADEESVDRAVFQLLVKFERTIDERFHDRLIADEIGIVFRYGDRCGPWGGSPIDQCRFFARDNLLDRGLRILPQCLPKSGVFHLESANAIVTGPEIELTGARVQVRRSVEVVF